MLKPNLNTKERSFKWREDWPAVVAALPFLAGFVLAIIAGRSCPSPILGMIGLPILWIVLTCSGGELVAVGIRSAIILVLAALLFPIFSQARANARATACLSNTKQIAEGILLYTQDYDGVMPSKTPSYAELVSPYVKNRQFFTCPLDPNGTISYTMNSNIAGLSLDVISSPDTTILIYEGKAGKLDDRHSGRAAIGSANGRCKLFSPEQATALIWTVQVSTKK